MRLLATAAAALAVAAPAPVGPREASWIARYLGWERPLLAQAVRPSPADGCAAEPAPAPTPRLAPVAAAGARGCVLLRRAAAATDGEADALRQQAASALGESENRLLAALPIGRALPVARGGASASHVDPALAAAVRPITKLAAQVRCWSAREWPEIEREHSLLFGGHPCPQTSGATSTPAGFRGMTKPSCSECRGMHDMAALARRLGAGATSARRLARLCWTRVYPTRPSEYRSPACRAP